MESILRHCAQQHALESIQGVSMNRRRSKSTLLDSMSYFPPSGITKDITMIVPAWSLSLLEECARANPDARICPLTYASVDRARQAKSVGSNSLVIILIAIRRSPNL